MNSQTQRFTLAGAAGSLECALDLPNPARFAAPRGIADLWRLDEASLARKGMQASGMTFLNAGDLHALRVRSTMCGACVVSLTHDDTLMGVVCMARQADMPLGQGDRQLLQWATDYLRDTILRTVDRAMIEQQARRDALTQLANRHTFDREIRRQMDDALEEAEFLCHRYGYLDKKLRQLTAGIRAAL